MTGVQTCALPIFFGAALALSYLTHSPEEALAWSEKIGKTKSLGRRARLSDMQEFYDHAVTADTASAWDVLKKYDAFLDNSLVCSMTRKYSIGKKAEVLKKFKEKHKKYLIPAEDKSGKEPAAEK